jgi:adenosylcobinamide-GDP ribazoletransferase
MNDTLPSDNENPLRFKPFAELLMSLRFLTRLPIPFARTIDPPPLAHAMRFFAVAGAVIGAINGVILVLLHYLHVPALMAATFTCVFGALITGALHEDGLADMTDGLFGGKSREQRLLIMRDSRIGSYGAMALGMALLARIGAYEALLLLNAKSIVLILASCAAFSRAMVVDMMWATRSARSDGLSVMAGRPGRNSALFAIACGAFLTLLATSGLRLEMGVIAMLAAVLVTGLLRRMAMKLIGGQTGDICGAVQVLSELAMLTVFASMIG